MGNFFTSLRYFTEDPNDAPDVDLPPTTDATNTAVPAPSTVPPPTNPKYDVFISHAGEDKATIALPLRERLRTQGITAFVDEADMQPGTEAQPAMIDAMETARVAVIVLSPEFIAREWPMKELMCFLRRRKECASKGQAAPVVIPFFYRLKIEELYGEPRFERRDKDGNLLYRKSRFDERQRRGDPEASVAAIKEALKTLHGIMGVRNDVNASNDSSYLMSCRRGLLLDQLCGKIEGTMPAGAAANLRSVNESSHDEQNQVPVDRFRNFFPPLSSGVRAVLDFDSKDRDGNPTTTEGRVKQLLIEDTSDSPRVVSLHGIGGVGKSTILEALSVDHQIRTRFPDGVHVMKLGMDASSGTLLRQIYRVLRESGAEKTYESLRIEKDTDEALRFLESWFERKKCAFLIDDAWVHGVELGLFSRLCKIGRGVNGNSVLITTREHEIASLAPRERIIRLEEREARGLSARQILFLHADRQEGDPSTTSADHSINRILDICAGLPVNLAAAGKNLKMMSLLSSYEGVWKQYLSRLVKCRDRPLRENVESYGNLFATFRTSISFLDEEPREETLGFASKCSFAEMHWRLCVLKKQEVVPNSMLKHLWKLETDEYADVIATMFVKLGLASRETVRYGEEYVSYLSLHDSLHDFALAEAKRLGDIKDAHECLLNGYKSCDREIPCEWWSEEIETDGYIHRNVCRHLVEAGRAAELVQLLLSPQWVERQLKVNDILFLQADFSLGIAAVQDWMRDKRNEELSAVEEALWLISQALNLSSWYISSNIVELWFQVHGRLIGYCDYNQAICDYVASIETEGPRPLILCKSSFLAAAGAANSRLVVSVDSYVCCMAMMNDGNRVVCGCEDGRIYVVNVKRSVVEKEWKAHDEWINAIAVGRDGTRLISCSKDNTAKVWEVETGHCVTSFTQHNRPVKGVALMKDGKRVISVYNDGTGMIWNIETGNILSKLLTSSDDYFSCVAVLGDEEELVVTGGGDGKLKMWNVTTGAQVGDTFGGHNRWVVCVAVTPDGRHVVSGSYDKTVRVWDVGSHKQLGSSLTGHSHWVGVGVSRDGRRLVSGSGSFDRTIRVWDLETRTQICDPLEGHTGWVTGVSFLGNGDDHIISCSRDGTLRVWDVTRKNTKKLGNRHEDVVTSVSFSPDGRFVVSGSYDNTLRIWDTTSTQQNGGPVQGHSSAVSDVAVTPNGRSVVSVSDDKTIRVWNLESHQLLHTFTGHTDAISCVAVTPQGDSVVTGSDDKTVRVWSLAPMDDSHVVLEGHSAPVRRVFVSDDGLSAVSADYQYHIFVWDLDAKKLVKQCTKDDALELSRRQILNYVGETTTQDDTTLSIGMMGHEIVYGEGPDETVLATMESEIISWALSPDKKTICVGMEYGQVEFMKLKT